MIDWTEGGGVGRDAYDVAVGWWYIWQWGWSDVMSSSWIEHAVLTGSCTEQLHTEIYCRYLTGLLSNLAVMLCTEDSLKILAVCPVEVLATFQPASSMAPWMETSFGWPWLKQLLNGLPWNLVKTLRDFLVDIWSHLNDSCWAAWWEISCS